jgi:hypothetical protein
VRVAQEGLARRTAVPEQALLRLARSSMYYTLRQVSPHDLALMRRIDELHLEHPFCRGTDAAGFAARRPHRTHEGRTAEQAYFGALGEKTPLAA